MDDEYGMLHSSGYHRNHAFTDSGLVHEERRPRIRVHDYYVSILFKLRLDS